MKRSLWFVSIVLLIFLSLGTPIAHASIHQYPEGTDQVMYRSLQTLRDGRDRAWQLVLFKRIKAGLTQSIHLRLVGFPGLVELEHPRSLCVASNRDKTWQAAELTAGVPVASHIAEYDFLAILRDLDADAPLTLTLPIAGNPTPLIVPPFVVQEWRRVAGSS